MFKEEVEKVSENQFKVSVTIEKRKFSYESKEIYKKDVKTLLPEEVRDRAVTESSPSKIISNIDRKSFTTTGVWIFNITPLEEKKTTTRRRVIKTSTTKKNNATIKEKEKNIS